MEKNDGSKVVKMGVAKNAEAAGDKPAQRLSYEDLQKVCDDLSRQGQQMQSYIEHLHKQIQQMHNIIENKRVDYLLRIIESKSPFFNDSFYNQCASEIVDILTLPTEVAEESKEG